MTPIREADPYEAAARAMSDDMRSLTAISCNDIRAMGQLIYAQHVLLEEIAAMAEQQCVASASGRAVARAVLATMVGHGSYDPSVYRKLAEDTHGEKDQDQD